MLKIDLDQGPSDKVIEILSNTEKLNFLSDNINFMNDIHFIQSFSGLIIKDEVITWLLINGDFRMQGSYHLATLPILDNFFKNSRDCLTFIKHIDNGDISYIFNKKFIQSLESPSVRELVGSHIGDYISNPNDKLNIRIMLAKDSAIF